MAGRGQVSWLPGLARRTFPGNPCHPQWLTQSACDVLDPVTVAGPRRLLTGLPLTTDRYLRGECIRCRGSEGACVQGGVRGTQRRRELSSSFLGLPPARP